MAFNKKSDGNIFSASDANMCFGSSLASVGLSGTGADGAYAPGGADSIDGIKHYTSITIAGGEVVTCCTSASIVTHIKCSGNATIAGTLSASGADGALGLGGTRVNPGGGTGGAVDGTAGNVLFEGTAPTEGKSGDADNKGGGGGAGYSSGGVGGGGGGTGGTGFTISNFDKEFLLWYGALYAGSGGGGGHIGGGGGGSGGLLIIDIEGDLTCTGSITANGGDGEDDSDDAGGGGGGGLVIIRVAGNADFTSGTVTANGGDGGDGDTKGGGGGGGGGAVFIFCGGEYTAPTTLTATGGALGAGGGATAVAGTNGITRIVELT